MKRSYILPGDLFGGLVLLCGLLWEGSLCRVGVSIVVGDKGHERADEDCEGGLADVEAVRFRPYERVSRTIAAP